MHWDLDPDFALQSRVAFGRSVLALMTGVTTVLARRAWYAPRRL